MATRVLSESQSLRKLLEVARMLAGPFELGEMLRQIVDAGREVLNADRGTVFLYDKERCELFVKIGTGIGDEVRFSSRKGIAGQCAEARKIINVPDCYCDSRFNQEIDRKTGYRTRNLLAVPLVGLDDELVGVMQMLNAAHGEFDANDEMIAEAFASHAAVAIQRARLLDERLIRLKLERDLQLARQIQEGVLPKQLPALAGYDLAGYSKPAEQTGGDIYDLIPIHTQPSNGHVTRTLVLLADATGHGIGPALSVTQVRSMIRVATRLNAPLDDMVAHINNQLTGDLASNRFVTAFVGVLDATTHELVYHAAGQGPLLHLRGGVDDCSFLPASTFPLGIMPDAPLDKPDPMQLEPGDLVVLLTDGFYEYQNRAGDQFGKDRIGDIICAHRHQSAREILDVLLEELWKFADGAEQMDDLTAVIVKRVDAV